MLNKPESRGHHHNRGQRPERRPAPPYANRLAARDALPHPLKESRVSDVPLSRRMNGPLPLQPPQAFRRARRTLPQMPVELLHRAGLEFSVEVGVELREPRLVGHDELLCNFPITAERKARRARDRRDITVPIGIVRVAAISWYDISSTSHNRRTSR